MDTPFASPRRFALYRRWLQATLGGILALECLLSFQWGFGQILGPRPLSPIRDWIHGCPQEHTLSEWAATIILLSLFFLHGYLAMTQPYEKPPLKERHGFGRKPPICWEVVYHHVQVATGILLVPLSFIFCYTMMLSPPDPAFDDWYHRLTSLGSRLAYVMLIPLLLLHATLGLGRLVARWRTSNPEAPYHGSRKWVLGSYAVLISSALTIAVIRGVPGFSF
ncbi:hypothetical protein [Ferrimonas balearica]|uniref:hypothetical protein n=1 Tax=Ferrimonas balearica TaxID=44012 RepID=UPI001C59FBA0|nr:hypothetical protein [Ferrimonas balearica]MBW3165545.1 hypothetical protein [Ferrimonas balearica]MBY6018630.1 hypothetical protein [Halomonas denitrificans]MBY6096418.1 hypothetical protein [Ferrimonas balearica]